MNTRITSLLPVSMCTLALLLLTLTFATAQTNRTGARAQGPGARAARSAFPWPLPPGALALIPAGGGNLPVIGGGTFGHITKWTGFGTNSVIGDSTIFEDKLGRVGIGTDSPASSLTVAGMIETTFGGLKFPDGTIQTTAGLGSIFHDGTLTGNGTNGLPFGVAIPLSLIGQAPDVFALEVVNTAASGAGVSIRGGDVGNGLSDGGLGIKTRGGDSTSTTGGDGADFTGGNSAVGEGGRGMNAHGGDSTSFFAGSGVEATGGDSGNGIGGPGLTAAGGQGSGAGNKGGSGIVAFGGLATGGAVNGLAAEFHGDVQVSGKLSKAAGSFKIDHPLDPENKYLYHSFVESPDMMNIYNGVVTLDQQGEAVVQLPEWFGALNREFRYQLTCIGAFAPVYIADEIKDNRFKIAGGQTGAKVSWQVTGIRQDAYANKNRIPVEEAKPEAERGTYLHPDAFNQPAERNVLFVHHPQLLKRVMESREMLQETRQK